MQWHNIHRGVSVDDDFALLHVILILLLDCVLYAAIAWYVEAVYPGEFGVPRPFYFPLLVSRPVVILVIVSLSVLYCTVRMCELLFTCDGQVSDYISVPKPKI